MVRLFVCIDLLGVVHTMTRHQKTRPETPEKRPTPDSTTAPERDSTTHSTPEEPQRQPETHSQTRQHPQPEKTTESHTESHSTTPETETPHSRQRDTLPDAPELPQSHFNALDVLETIKP